MPDPILDAGIDSLVATSLRFASGPFVLEVARLALRGLAPQVAVEGGQTALRGLQAASAEFSGVKLHGPLVPAPHPEGAWNLGPLAAADGTVRARIVDAHLLFDADVTVPIRRGQVDFDDATVEHVGPDSRMGVSRLGLYVDAANGRSYLFQFPATPVAGIEYERRGTLLGPWVSDRGQLRLQEFVQGLLGQPSVGKGPGFTEQTRLLLDRTALSGEVQLGDGQIAAPGVRAELSGGTAGRNAVRLHSEAVGRGVTVELAALSIRDAAAHALGVQLGCDDMTGALTLRLLVEDGTLRFVLELEDAKVSGLRVRA
jgi:hypothetical protein